MTPNLSDLTSAVWWLVCLIPRGIRGVWRSITPEGARKFRDVCFVILIIMVGYIGLQNRNEIKILGTVVEDGQERGRQNRRTLQEIERLANIIESQTSPEAQARQQETIDSIITIIGCENEDTIQRLVDVLVEREVLEPGTLQVITDECQLILAGEQP